MIIKTLNNLDQFAPVTYISGAVSSGTTVIPLKNTSQLTAQWAVQIGNTGEELSEIKVLVSGAPSGTLGTISAALSFDHPADTPVYAVKFDQIVFERSTAGTSGTASPITNGTVTIQSDSNYTFFDDTTGSASYAYKTKFRNSSLSTESSESDWLTVSGFSYYSLSYLRTRIKGKLWSSTYVKDPVIDDWINEWLERMTNTAIAVNQDYNLGTVDVGFSGTADTATITSADFKFPQRVWFTSDGNTYREAVNRPINNIHPNETVSSYNPIYGMLGDTTLVRRPNDTAGTARIVYAKTMSRLSNDTDELPLSMRGYTKSFVDYGLSQAYRLDSKFEVAKEKETDALSELERFRMEISPRQRSGNSQVQIVEPEIYGMSDY